MTHVETVTVHAPGGGPLVVNRDQYDADPDRWGGLWTDADTAAMPDEPDTNLKGLRAELERLTGKKTFNGWDADQIRAKIAEHAKPLQTDGIPAPGTVAAHQSTMPQNLNVTREGDRYFVVDNDGIPAAGFFAEGYNTDVDAWTAVTQVNVPKQG